MELIPEAGTLITEAKKKKKRKLVLLFYKMLDWLYQESNPESPHGVKMQIKQ